MTAYEIVDRSEIEPRLGGKPSQRKDITELLLAVPQDGRVLRKDYSSNQDLKKVVAEIRELAIEDFKRYELAQAIQGCLDSS